MASVLHDSWVGLDEIEFDRTEKTCTLKVYRRSGEVVPSSILLISGVEEVLVDDTEGIGRYDINRLVYEEGELKFEFNIPAKLVFRMSVPRGVVSLSWTLQAETSDNVTPKAE